ncbi:MAG: hypothetical protein EP330_06920 [Deltaproteobacteria bacterium]|nr:MAG: hypothetical protein EP330_06920 [Deltaproteobacteria bacterium]
MFQTPQNVRDAVKTQSEMVAEMTDRVLDWQLDAMKVAQKQMTSAVDASVTAFETSAKATREMQKSFIAGMTPAETKA